MNESILMYDVLDEKNNIINSQVLINNMGFEIPDDYYFDEDLTKLKDNVLYLTNGINDIKIHYEKCDANNFDRKIKELEGKFLILENFENYRGQKIIEYEDENCIDIVGYDGEYIFGLSSDCKKYSSEYFTLYYLLFSFDSKCNGNYDNLYYQRNSLSILTNGKYVYDKYNKNILKFVPEKLLSILVNNSFCDYLRFNKVFDFNLCNYYIKKDEKWKKIIDKIDKYVDTDSDDISMIDLFVE